MYEILCILPGTITEQEAKLKIGEVESKIKALGVEIEDTVVLGRQKIAYPIKHIPYGYFCVFYGHVDPDKINKLRKQMEQSMGLLRVIARQFIPEKNRKVTIEATTTTPPKRYRKPVPEKSRIVAPPSVPAPTLATSIETFNSKKEEAVSAEPEPKKVDLEEIDRKLDELLESDLMIDNI